MSLSIGFALVSLVFAGLTDVAFKRYARRDRSRGIYLAGMGFVWGFMQMAIIIMSGVPLATDVATISFGLIAGIFVSLANLCLIESMAHIPVSLASTVYRLNTVGVVLMAVVLLAEPITSMKLLGVAVGLGAVLLLYEPSHSANEGARWLISFFGLAVLASFLRACFGIITKYAATLHIDLPSVLLYNTTMWVLLGLLYAKWREGRVRLHPAKIRYSLISGLLICGVANFLALALQTGEASIVVPVANMSFLVAIALSTVWKMEVLTVRKILAICLAALAIVTLAMAA